MSSRFLVLHFCAPLLSYGGEAVDNRRINTEFPRLSMVTGLLGNALGYRREEGDRLSTLQRDIEMGSVIWLRGEFLRDFKTARIRREDAAWTTAGIVIERSSGEKSYAAPQILECDYWSDSSAVTVLRLRSDSDSNFLETVSEALRFPARPLFLGRKCCIPSDLIFSGFVFAQNVLDALTKLTPPEGVSLARVQWPSRPAESVRKFEGVRGVTQKRICDERDFVIGVHGGERLVFEGTMEVCAQGGQS